VRRWLKVQGRDADLAKFALDQERYLQVVSLLVRTRGELAVVYRSALPPPSMREKKKAVFAELDVAFAQLKTQWNGHAPFEGWFAAGMNNANLVSVDTYRRCVPGFARELAAVDGDFTAFFVRARAIARQPLRQRHQLLCGD